MQVTVAVTVTLEGSEGDSRLAGMTGVGIAAARSAQATRISWLGKGWASEQASAASPSSHLS